MTFPDSGPQFPNFLADPLPPGPDARQIAAEVFQRDRRRTRLLASLSVLFWLIGLAGLFVLVAELDTLVAGLRIVPPHGTGNSPILDRGQVVEWTGLIHHSFRFIEGSVFSLSLAVIFTVWLIFSSRRATLNRINFSLMRICESLRTGHDPVAEPIARSSTQSARTSWLFSLLFLLCGLISGAVVTAVLMTGHSWHMDSKLFHAARPQEQMQIHGGIAPVPHRGF